MPTFNFGWFILGCVGGMLPDILRIIKGRHKRTLPAYLKTLNFWLGFFLLVGVGGLAAWIFGATQPREALAYGFAAPEVFSRLASKEDERLGDRGLGSYGVRSWWAV